MAKRARSAGAIAHSRAREEKTSQTELRVALIRRLMATSAWGPEVRAQLAKQWDLTEARVSHLAAEASRSLRVDEREVEQERAKLIAGIEEAHRHAMTDRHNVSGQLDLRAALDALELKGKYLGIAPKEAAATAPVVINVSSEWLARPPAVASGTVVELLPEHAGQESNGAGYANGNGANGKH